MENKPESDRSGMNRFGEEKIRPDIFEEKSGMRHPLLGELEHSVEWSSDPRSEASHEKHHSRVDELLEEAIIKCFLENATFDSSQIRVTVIEGVVTLQGRVRHATDLDLVEVLTRDVDGVQHIDNLLSQ